MPSKPAASVVLPVFNAGQPLRRAVESILAQDFIDFELIILDDASSDDSAAISAGYAARDPRVRFIRHTQNQGLAATLNEGLSLSRTPLIARMDQDDESLPHRLRVQLEFFGTHREVSVAGSYVYHMGARPRFDHLIDLPTSPDEVRQALKQYNCLYHPAVMFRRSAVEAAGGYRADFVNAEDYELWLRLSRRQALCNIPEPLLRYRFSPGGMTLGRKWQQLYYVYLAQAMHAGGSVPLQVARARADQLLRETDRRYFFGEVAKGTVVELLRLRLWRDAVRVVVSFESEIDPNIFTELARRVLRASLDTAPAL
jgi:glycosyltransferase involved in cell wall biosynthesis